ncbi:hypothetical protein ABEF95_003665 [Exophiala dermatitidis]
MPSNPTLSLSNFLNSAASSSRKRPHAEITRSESRSISPNLPSKRRRISRSMNSSLFSTSSPTPTPTPTSAVTRSERDGYDYRYPVMSSHTTRASQGATGETIDLTADSDSDDDNDTASRQPPRRNPQPQQRPRQSRSRPVPHGGAPPFDRRVQPESLEVIDLLDDSDYQIEENDEERQVLFDGDSDTGYESPDDVQIVDERPALPGNRRPTSTRPTTRRPSPRQSARPTWANIPDMIRRSGQYMFGNAANINEVLLNRLDGLRARTNDDRQDHGARDDGVGNFIINLDYRQPAFALGGLEIYDRSSETPQGPGIGDAYKAPPPPPQGFIRTFAEDDVVLCPMCGDELATGKGDTKQQVWVAKQCGHVYCGECATNRFSSKSRKKDKKAAPSKVVPFSECNIDGCKTKLNNKHAMFPVYL